MRDSKSHKGQNGKVLIIGGSEMFHGAPILAALGAEKSGVDLTYLLVPRSQKSFAQNYSLNFVVGTFATEFLSGRDIKKVADWADRVDCCVIGNGIGGPLTSSGSGVKPTSLRVVRELIKRSQCKKYVLDGGAIASEVLGCIDTAGKDVVITPHCGELERISSFHFPVSNTGKRFKTQRSKDIVYVFSKACELTIVLKGHEDLIVGFGGKMHINKTGHAIMTKGGTGDVLAGLIGGLMAQGMSGFDASKMATKVWGKVGEAVYKKNGLMSDVEDLVSELGHSFDRL